MTLGPANAFARNYTCDRVRGEHVHMDWPEFYDKMKTNYVGYQKKVQAELEDVARVQRVLPTGASRAGHRARHPPAPSPHTLQVGVMSDDVLVLTSE